MAVMSGSREPLKNSADRHGGGCRVQMVLALAEEAVPPPRSRREWRQRLLLTRRRQGSAARSSGVAATAPRTGPAAATECCGCNSGEGPAAAEGAWLEGGGGGGREGSCCCCSSRQQSAYSVLPAAWARRMGRDRARGSLAALLLLHEEKEEPPPPRSRGRRSRRTVDSSSADAVIFLPAPAPPRSAPLAKGGGPAGRAGLDSVKCVRRKSLTWPRLALPPPPPQKERERQLGPKRGKERAWGGERKSAQVLRGARGWRLLRVISRAPSINPARPRAQSRTLLLLLHTPLSVRQSVLSPLGCGPWAPAPTACASDCHHGCSFRAREENEGREAGRGEGKRGSDTERGKKKGKKVSSMAPLLAGSLRRRWRKN